MFFSVASQSRYSRRIKFHLCILACLLLQGCTLGLWRAALVRDLKYPTIRGKITINPSYLGNSLLIVRYGRSFGMYWYPVIYDYAIPYVNGRVPDILDYSGSQRGVNDIFGDLSQERLNRIQNYRFTEVFVATHHHQYTDKDFDRAFESGRVYPGDGVCLIPYLLEYSATRQNDRTAQKEPLVPPFDPRCKIIILPARQKRLISEQAEAICAAIIQTPFTLVADIVVIPSSILCPAAFMDMFD